MRDQEDRDVIAKVFIDMDGVLADFFSAGFRLFGRDPATMPRNFDGWLPDVLGCTEQEFWSKIDESYWVGLDEMPDARDLVALCQRCCRAVGILTSPGNAASACSGKKQWVIDHFPELAKTTFIGSRKEMLAHPGAVLLDDWAKNVEAWTLAGGHGVLVPRRWNAEHELDAVSTVADRLRCLSEYTVRVTSRTGRCDGTFPNLANLPGIAPLAEDHR